MGWSRPLNWGAQENTEAILWVTSHFMSSSLAVYNPGILMHVIHSFYSHLKINVHQSNLIFTRKLLLIQNISIELYSLEQHPRSLVNLGSVWKSNLHLSTTTHIDRKETKLFHNVVQMFQVMFLIMKWLFFILLIDTSYCVCQMVGPWLSQGQSY